MDWFGWLSRTGLDPELAYVYGLELTRNELQEEDLPYFDHEFLQSMGISIAKHRLEILKLARKDASRADGRLSGLVNVISRTKRSVGKYIGRLISHEPTEGARESTREAMTRKDNSDKEIKHRSLALSGPLDGKYQHKYLADARRSPKFSGPLMHGPRSPNLLWPLDAKPREEVMLTSRSPKSSGAVDRRPVTNGSPRFPRPPERATSGSPRISGPLEGTGPSPRVSPRVRGGGNFQNERVVNGFDEHSLWAKLFHDMKPT